MGQVSCFPEWLRDVPHGANDRNMKPLAPILVIRHGKRGGFET